MSNSALNRRRSFETDEIQRLTRCMRNMITVYILLLEFLSENIFTEEDATVFLNFANAQQGLLCDELIDKILRFSSGIEDNGLDKGIIQHKFTFDSADSTEPLVISVSRSAEDPTPFLGAPLTPTAMDARRETLQQRLNLQRRAQDKLQDTRRHLKKRHHHVTFNNMQFVQLFENEISDQSVVSSDLNCQFGNIMQSLQCNNSSLDKNPTHRIQRSRKLRSAKQFFDDSAVDVDDPDDNDPDEDDSINEYSEHEHYQIKFDVNRHFFNKSPVNPALTKATDRAKFLGLQIAQLFATYASRQPNRRIVVLPYNKKDKVGNYELSDKHIKADFNHSFVVQGNFIVGETTQQLRLCISTPVQVKTEARFSAIIMHHDGQNFQQVSHHLSLWYDHNSEYNYVSAMDHERERVDDCLVYCKALKLKDCMIEVTTDINMMTIYHAFYIYGSMIFAMALNQVAPKSYIVNRIIIPRLQFKFPNDEKEDRVYVPKGETPGSPRAKKLYSAWLKVAEYFHANKTAQQLQSDGRIFAPTKLNQTYFIVPLSLPEIPYYTPARLNKLMITARRASYNSLDNDQWNFLRNLTTIGDFSIHQTFFSNLDDSENGTFKYFNLSYLL